MDSDWLSDGNKFLVKSDQGLLEERLDRAAPGPQEGAPWHLHSQKVLEPANKIVTSQSMSRSEHSDDIQNQKNVVFFRFWD